VSIRITELSLQHIDDLVTLYAETRGVYSQYFTPFSFDRSTLRNLVESRQRDCYFVVLLDERIAGFYMLRGFDQGYIRPTYGVWIAERHSGRGLALATLNHAVSVCQDLACSEIMLRVHRDNRRARGIYEQFGFRECVSDDGDGNAVLNLCIARP
jgi:RimJ/RimL family protein N-acetyltransferase